MPTRHAARPTDNIATAQRMTNRRQLNAIHGRPIGHMMTASRQMATPTMMRRNVSAFGEITVLPVGDNEDNDLRIAVQEEIVNRNRYGQYL